MDGDGLHLFQSRLESAMSEVPKVPVGGLPIEGDGVEDKVGVDDRSRVGCRCEGRPVYFQPLFSRLMCYLQDDWVARCSALG